MKRVDFKIGTKKRGEIFLFFDHNQKNLTKKKYISQLVSEVKPIMGFGFAGFSHKKFLSQKLQETMFDSKSGILEKCVINQKDVLKVIVRSLNKVQKILPIEPLYVYVFPHSNSFIKSAMGGTAGSVIWKNTLILFVNSVKAWQKYLEGSVIHEYNHSVAFKTIEWNSLLDKIILEGMAELFLEEIFPKAPFKVGSTLSYHKSIQLFKNIKSKLSSTRYSDYDEIFYKNGKYPLWSGYSVGYWILKDFRKKYPKYQWPKIVRLGSSQILKMSGWDKK